MALILQLEIGHSGAHLEEFAYKPHLLQLEPGSPHRLPLPQLVFLNVLLAWNNVIIWKSIVISNNKIVSNNQVTEVN